MDEKAGKRGDRVEVNENEILQAIQVVHRLIEIAKKAFIYN
jgi:hypothetical protein